MCFVKIWTWISFRLKVHVQQQSNKAVINNLEANRYAME